MIFRKPYAFLIKNFRKIHILLFALTLFIFYKQSQILTFVREYISLGSYSFALESIESKINFGLYTALILIIAISLALMWLLYYKKKPWKGYLIVIAEYILMLVAFSMTKSFFVSYSTETVVSGVYTARDLLNIAGILQYIVFIFLIIRIMGVDLNKFSFNTDKEFLELNSSDREEFEISFNIDRHSLLRTFNRLKRNIAYFYIEHKFVCNIFLIGILVLSLGYSYYYFEVVHKSYKENEVLNTGVYSISIKNSYITDKDLAGEKIEKGTKFVIINLVMKNNSDEAIEPNLDRFHLINSNIDKTYSIYYNNYFSDLGTPVTAKMNLNSHKEKEFYMVFSVNEKLKNNDFVLYYQELGGKRKSYLRKIKLKLKDVSKIEQEKTYKIGENITFEYVASQKKDITIEKAEIVDNTQYNRYMCTAERCNINTINLNSTEEYKILKIDFSSSDFEGLDFIDFCKKYGKIKYENDKGKEVYSDVVDAIGVKYEGKEVFLKINNDIATSKNLSLVYTLRNKRYIIKIK